MYLVKTPNFIQNLFPNFYWKIDTKDPVIYLTFDDGPIPQITPWVLKQLNEYNALATFFCVGDNVTKYPKVFNQVLENGHAVGNHTYNHKSGWLTDNIPYYHNVRKCAQQVKSDLFRPPYGRLKPNQVQFLQRHYKIIMWDVLSADFDSSISPEKCYFNVIRNTMPGSIIVFHDSIKAKNNLEYALPKVLEYFSKRGFRFDTLHHLMHEHQNILLRKIA